MPVVILLFIRSKIQFFESKSQHSCFSGCRLKSCLSDQRYNFLKANHNRNPVHSDRSLVVYQIKDTIFWKQITTIIGYGFAVGWLFIRSKIQFFESKSQHGSTRLKITPRCLSDQRYNFLKANHNQNGGIVVGLEVVYQIKDTIFWKQFTISIVNQLFT